MSHQPALVIPQLVALGKHGTWYIQDQNGKEAYSKNIPTALKNLLTSPKRTSKVTHIALSPSDQSIWYVCLTNGEVHYDVGKNNPVLKDILESSARAWRREAGGSSDTTRRQQVIQLTFGRDSDAVALYKGEQAVYAWSALPKGLHNKLNGRQRWLPSATNVALDEMGGWYIDFEDGEQTANVTRPPEAIQPPEGMKVATTVFGDKGRYFTRFEDIGGAGAGAGGADITHGSNSSSNNPGGRVKLKFDVNDGFWNYIHGTRRLNPCDILYTSDTIRNHFDDRTNVRTTVDYLKAGKMSPYDITPIQVARDERGTYWALNNRRLWVFQEAGVKEIPCHIYEERNLKQFRRTGDGKSVTFID